MHLAIFVLKTFAYSYPNLPLFAITVVNCRIKRAKSTRDSAARRISFRLNNRSDENLPGNNSPTAVESGTTADVAALKVGESGACIPNSPECTSYNSPGAALSGLSRRARTIRGCTCLKFAVLSSRTHSCNGLHVCNPASLSGSATDGPCGFPRVAGPAGRKTDDSTWRRSNELCTEFVPKSCFSCRAAYGIPTASLRAQGQICPA